MKETSMLVANSLLRVKIGYLIRRAPQLGMSSGEKVGQWGKGALVIFRKTAESVQSPGMLSGLRSSPATWTRCRYWRMSLAATEQRRVDSRGTAALSSILPPNPMSGRNSVVECLLPKPAILSGVLP